jgi:hypothetical protein
MFGGKLETCLTRNGEYADAGHATIGRTNSLIHIYFMFLNKIKTCLDFGLWSENSGF